MLVDGCFWEMLGSDSPNYDEVGCKASDHIYSGVYGKCMTTIMLKNSLVPTIASGCKGRVSDKVI